ncbi:MAG: recombinase family protein [Candidatus Omnitrophota bacterium]|nr:recombinase family protein [Candidatus Omnitrophota bacterium]
MGYLADCIIYPRVSTLKQKEGSSPQEQIKSGIEYCKKKGWTYKIVDDDLGFSASSPRLEDRAGLTKIVDWAEDKLFKFFFVQEYDRFTRNPIVEEFVKVVFRDNGIKIITPFQEFDLEKDEDDFLSALLGLLAKRENKRRIRGFKAGKKGSREKGLYCGGVLPLGYTTNDAEKYKNFIVNPKTAPLYRRIVAEYLKGISSAGLAEKFNKEGIPSVKSSWKFKNSRVVKWTGGAIRDILKNKFYLGKVIEGRQVIPPLISQEEWQRVQKRLAVSAKRTGPSGTKIFLLRDLLWCAKCGVRIKGRTFFSETKKTPAHWIRQYFCSGRITFRDYRGRYEVCKLPLIDMDKLDALVWNRLSMYLLNVDELKKELQKPFEKDDTQKIKERVLDLEGELKRLQQGRNDVLGMLGSGYWSKDEVEKKAEEVMATISEKEIQLSQLKDKVEGEKELEYSLLSLREISKQVKDTLWKFTIEQKRELVLKTVKKIKIDFAEENEETSISGIKVDIAFEVDIMELRNHFELKQRPQLSFRF